MPGTGKKPIDALKAKFIYPAMLISALNFSACKSDKKGQVTEHGKDSHQTENVVAGDTITAKQHFDSLKTEAIEAESNKINKEDNLHYDNRSSLNGLLTHQLNSLGPGFSVQNLRPFNKNDHSEYRPVMAIEFYYDEKDIKHTGENFKGYVCYFGDSLDNNEQVSIITRHPKGYYIRTNNWLLEDTLAEHSVKYPMEFILEVLDAELKDCMNVVINGQKVDNREKIEDFIYRISNANKIDISKLRKPNNYINLGAFYDSIHNDQP